MPAVNSEIIQKQTAATTHHGQTYLLRHHGRRHRQPLLELQLDRNLSNKRIFPAVNIVASSTRRDDLLLDKTTLDRMWILRKYLADMNPIARYKDLVLEQIPELGPEQVLCEPVGRNTAPCICYAAYGLQKRDPGAKMIVTPADHLILNEEDFRAIIGECLDFIDDRAALMTVGIKPTRPETGYGYIQVSDDRTISKVKCFTEKPNLELAQTFLQCGEFLWNSGIFVWKVGDIIEAVRTYLPEHHALFSDIQPVLGTSEEAEAIARVFSECRSISIDYGVMEKANNVYVRRGEFGWSDVGTWGSLYQHARKDRYANAKPEKGCYTDENTRSCIVSLPEGKVAVINGLKEYIVVDTEDVLLICPRSEEQNIKKFIDEVKYNEGDKHI